MSIEQRRAADFPRPPVIEPEGRCVRIVLGGETIVETTQALRVLETWHPPTYYIPFAAFRPGALAPAPGRSVCEWKGVARYHTVRGGGRAEPAAAWSYPDPLSAYAALRDHVAVYAGRMDACMVGEERVTPQPGGFYGGWITADVIGPFKGAPGTEFW
jgi:uncharacterized protein (DUF427 family)